MPEILQQVVPKRVAVLRLRPALAGGYEQSAVTGALFPFKRRARPMSKGTTDWLRNEPSGPKSLAGVSTLAS
jgi:hypothetical protein